MVNRAECSFHKMECCKRDNEEPSSCVIPVGNECITVHVLIQCKTESGQSYTGRN